MADHKIYFGTKEHMRWVKCPNSGITLNRVGWSASGTYLNGGGWSRTSATTHFEPSMTWSFLNHIEVHEIMDFYYGVHGQGPFYWLDPFSMGTNVLPVHWSVPRLAAEDAPSLVKGRRPTLSATGANLISLPSKTATYELKPGDMFDSLFIPVPPGFTAYVAAWGSSTGTAALQAGGVTFPLTDESVSEPTWTAVQEVDHIDLSLSGVGFLSLAGIVVQVLPAGAPVIIPGLMTSVTLQTSPSLQTSATSVVWVGGETPSSPRFLPGAGHSGCMFKSPPSPVGYSAPQALDYQSLTAEFVEVGAWLS